MPEYIRSLTSILILSFIIFKFSKSTSLLILKREDFVRRCNLWLSLTCIIFLVNSMFLYIILGSLLLLLTTAKEKNKIAMFIFLVYALPSTPINIPFFGIVNFLFSIDHIRLLELAILMPLSFRLLQNNDTVRLFKMPSDKYLFSYLTWSIFLLFLASTITDTLRFIFYVFLDVFLPYYVISRGLKNIQDFRDVLFSFLVSCTVLALIGIFEYFKGWLLYHSLLDVLNMNVATGRYLMREGGLRVMASTGHALVFGYLLVIALGFFLVIQKHIKNHLVRGIWLALILGALIAPQSRGPWVGAFVLIIVFILTGPKLFKGLIIFGITSCLGFGLLQLTPFGEKIINNLPFIGTTGQFNITYRQLLIENCIRLVLHNPIFGVPNAFEELKMLRQGEGIIDIVNTYVSIALESGLVGLSLFIAFFTTILVGIFKEMQRVKNINEELHLIGRVLLATLVAILVMIATVSNILFIPITYWSVTALGLAYIRIVRCSVVIPIIHEPLLINSAQ